MTAETEKILKNLNLSNDEVDKLSKAFEKPEFRQLFKEYAQEISDPENRRKYEEELTQMEADRGVDIEFINPEPVYVLKTRISSNTRNPAQIGKFFINVCRSDKIGKPSMEQQRHSGQSSADGRGGGRGGGALWSLPHSFGQIREDLDKCGAKCQVIDICFHPDCVRMGERNAAFQRMLDATALEGVEKNFGVTLTRSEPGHVKRMRAMKSKGAPLATVIRRKQHDFEQKQSEAKQLEQNSGLKYPDYPYANVDSHKNGNGDANKNGNAEVGDCKHATPLIEELTDEDKSAAKPSPPTYKTPKYAIKYQDRIELSNFIGVAEDVSELPSSSSVTSSPSAPSQPPSAMPRPSQDKIIVEVNLPGISSAKSLDVDVSCRQMQLICERPVKYRLDISLPVEVIEEETKADFDKTTSRLRLEIKIRPKKQSLASDNKSPQLQTDYPIVELPTNETASVSMAASANKDENAEQEAVHKQEKVEKAENQSDKSGVDEHEILNFLKFSTHCSLDSVRIANWFCKQDTGFEVNLLIDIKNASIAILKNRSRRLARIDFSSRGQGGFVIKRHLLMHFPEGVDPTCEAAVQFKAFPIEKNVIVRLIINTDRSLFAGVFDEEANSAQHAIYFGETNQNWRRLIVKKQDKLRNIVEDLSSTSYQVRENQISENSLETTPKPVVSQMDEKRLQIILGSKVEKYSKKSLQKQNENEETNYEKSISKMKLENKTLSKLSSNETLKNNNKIVANPLIKNTTTQNTTKINELFSDKKEITEESDASIDKDKTENNKKFIQFENDFIYDLD